jgi:DnaJ-class molecular chaperone
MADACSKCGGLGTVRIRTGNGGQTIPCGECGGSGQMRPGPRKGNR